MKSVCGGVGSGGSARITYLRPISIWDVGVVEFMHGPSPTVRQLTRCLSCAEGLGLQPGKVQESDLSGHSWQGLAGTLAAWHGLAGTLVSIVLFVEQVRPGEAPYANSQRASSSVRPVTGLTVSAEQVRQDHVGFMDRS